MSLPEALGFFRQAGLYVETSGALLGLDRVKFFGSYFREPHYCSNYRQLREIELELNAGVDYAADYELLSIWRLAHDAGYAKWAYSIGTRRCQIALFGLEQTNDWFCRRQGAHNDIITATLRLIENGIAPRWMVFLTKRGLPEFAGILRLIETLKLTERVASIGSRFDVFLNDPTPIGEAQQLEDIRLTSDDVPHIPRELIWATEQYTKKGFDLRTESDWVTDTLGQADGPIGLDYPKELWFFVASDWSVYPNIGTLEPWWRLGNLRTDAVSSLLTGFRNDEAPALSAGASLGLHSAARRYGDPKGTRVYGSKTDLHQLWLERHCADLSLTATRD